MKTVTKESNISELAISQRMSSSTAHTDKTPVLSTLELELIKQRAIRAAEKKKWMEDALINDQIVSSKTNEAVIRASSVLSETKILLDRARTDTSSQLREQLAHLDLTCQERLQEVAAE